MHSWFNWTEEQLEDYQRRHAGDKIKTPDDKNRFVTGTGSAKEPIGGIHIGQPHPSKTIDQPRPLKYRNHKTKIDGINFDSLIEAAYYLHLQDELKMRRIQYFLRQVPIRLPGGVTYWCDFMVVRACGERLPIEYVDVKGRRTQTFINKKKQVEALYPLIKILEVTRADIEKCFINTARELGKINA